MTVLPDVSFRWTSDVRDGATARAAIEKQMENGASVRRLALTAERLARGVTAAEAVRGLR